tara:strand:- start:1121 stop:1603 length:483 start_codon:yes stop_codon:yes gene_type:complete
MTIYQNLPDAEIQMLISAYETKLRKIVQPLQRFETGIALQSHKLLYPNNDFWKCEPVNFKNRMGDHNYRVSIGTPDCLTDVVYTRKFRNSSVYREWYLTEIRYSYNEIYARITQLAQSIGYDYSHLVGQLNFTKEEQASMDYWSEKNARGPVAADGWEGY